MHINCQLYSLTFGSSRNCYSVISLYCDDLAKMFGKYFIYIQFNLILSYKLSVMIQQQMKLSNIWYKMFSFPLNEMVNNYKKYWTSRAIWQLSNLLLKNLLWFFLFMTVWSIKAYFKMAFVANISHYHKKIYIKKKYE